MKYEAGEDSPQEQEYTEKELGNYKNPSHALCPACSVIQPISHFKRRLSKQHTAKRLGKQTANTGMEVTSKYCKACQKKRIKKKPITRKTRAELRNAVSYGDIHPVIAENIIKERDEALNPSRSAHMKKRWADVRAAELSQYRKKLSEQVLRLGNYYHANKKNQACQELLSSALYAYKTAQQARDNHINKLKLSGEKPPQSVPNIEDLYTWEEKQEMQRLKQQIPHEVLSKQRIRKRKE